MAEAGQQSSNGAGAGTGQQAGAGAGSGAGQQGAATDWFGADHKEFVTTKGWKSADDVITSARNLETLLGTDRAGRTIVLPKDDKDADGIKAFRAKLGVPDNADAYQLPVPEGADGTFAKTAAGWMHELGIPLKEAQGLTTKWNEHFAKLMDESDKAAKAKSEADIADLQKKWGAKFEENGELGRRFAKELGVTDEELNTIESALGTARMLTLFHGGGAKLGEPGAVNTGGASGFTSQGQKAAQDQIKALQQQRIAGQVTQKEFDEKMAKLGPIAYPGERAA